MKKLFPRYTWLPAALIIVINMLAYSVAGFLVDDSRRRLLATAVDDLIPLLPFTIFPYVLCFLQWLLSWLLIIRQGERFFYRYAKADVIAKSITLATYIIFPTVIVRPPMETTDFASRFLGWIWSIDRPINGFPSIHIIASWIAMRAALRMKGHALWKTACVLMTIGCVISVVTTKQHVFVDIPGGILCAELGLAVSGRLDDSRFLRQRAGEDAPQSGD